MFEIFPPRKKYIFEKNLPSLRGRLRCEEELQRREKEIEKNGEASTNTFEFPYIAFSRFISLVIGRKQTSEISLGSEYLTSETQNLEIRQSLIISGFDVFSPFPMEEENHAAPRVKRTQYSQPKISSFGPS
ncbi:hypothetical protein AVEN_245346-1 [Araneus ventricosus]|uniref:Uncharacterized protein n=1 Tax=Araneus ventricosus TaxID=182803 RepID=A0A4Y2FG65_ARAVE|nr:hypothetical protein AVEN_245346-1 [Araneus ventricosus]